MLATWERREPIDGQPALAPLVERGTPHGHLPLKRFLRVRELRRKVKHQQVVDSARCTEGPEVSIGLTPPGQFLPSQEVVSLEVQRFPCQGPWSPEFPENRREEVQ